MTDAPATLARPDGGALAYHATPAADPGDGRPGLVFCGGFASDMTGTKATALEAYARDRGLAFVRFDYLGHGASSGAFADGTIGRWAEDAMLLAALARPARIAGLVGIAPAPDFTEDLMWDRYDADVRAILERDGIYREPSAYDEEPYTITRDLIEDGRTHLLLRGPIPLACPVRILHGMRDEAVPWQTALRSPRRAHRLTRRRGDPGEGRRSSPVGARRPGAAIRRRYEALGAACSRLALFRLGQERPQALAVGRIGQHDAQLVLDPPARRPARP
jgi:pimeloyl-ACP methyl ester carboxylesterase